MKKLYLLRLITILLITFSPYSLGDILWDLENPMVKIYSEKYETEPVVVVALAQRMNYPDDISVTLYLAKLLEAEPFSILDSRLEGKSWMEIIKENKLSPEILFTGLSKSHNAWFIITKSTLSQLKPYMTEEKISLLNELLNKEFSEKELNEKLLEHSFTKEEIERIISFSELKTLPKIYRRAWVEFEKFKADNSYEMAVYDDEVRRLVQLKSCAEFLNKDPWYVINEICNGTSYSDIILNNIKAEASGETK